MIFKEKQVLYSSDGQGILLMHKILSAGDNFYRVNGFIPNRYEGAIRTLNIDQLENDQQGVGTIRYVRFSLSRIVALHQTKEQLETLLAKKPPLVLPREELEKRLSNINSIIEEHRVSFFTKNITDGTETNK